MPRGYVKRTTITSTRATSYANRGRDARQNKFAKARTAVAKIQRKPYIPRMVKNTQSVYALAAAVKKLQQSKIGMFQKRAESVQWLKTEPASYPFGKSQPFAICLNQFVDKKLGTDSSLPSTETQRSTRTGVRTTTRLVERYTSLLAQSSLLRSSTTTSLRSRLLSGSGLT